MLKIAVLTPFHCKEGFSACAPQLRNYSYYLRNAECLFVFHLSSETPRSDLASMRNYLSSEHHDVVYTDYSVVTSRFGSSNAIPVLWETLRKQFTPDYIIYRSASDLIFREGIPELMQRYPYAVNSSGFTLHSSKWKWRLHIKRDPRIKTMQHLLMPDRDKLYCGRVGCSYYSYDLWREMMDWLTRMGRKGRDVYFSNVKNHWPAEEVIIPTLSRVIADKQNLRNYGRSLSFAKDDHSSERMNLQDIELLRKEGLYYAAKRFHETREDPAFLYLTSHIPHSLKTMPESSQ